uniref:Ribosomal protein S20 n=1 Tax=Gastroclonium compressum TaxID=1852973 RepID=A0A173G017_GASCM|nr:ribosomal protein S20 [Coeloseira compressa]ANH09619.1 ribosomal protein S20 [Coeloseira compressa]
MSKNLSAFKKVQISLRNRARNKVYKSSIKTLIKKYTLNLQNNTTADISYHKLNLSAAYHRIDKAVKRGVLHKNNAARKKAHLARAMKKFLNL